VAAWLVGTLVLWGTGVEGGAVLAAFFVSSSLISWLAPPPPEHDPKGERRDARQVLANGGVAAVVATLGLLDLSLGLWLLTSSLAAAAADTWATSIGARSPAPPRLLWSGRPVPRGTSGGVTLRGCIGGWAGALLVAGTGAAAGGQALLVPVAGLIGFVGMLADSGLGASLQGRFHCPTCGLASEWPVHRCGTVTHHQGGLRWLDNDGVNLSATAAAALAGFAAWAALCC
jgi:uncharacterized protein (TIGR00297 family)